MTILRTLARVAGTAAILAAASAPARGGQNFDLSDYPRLDLSDLPERHRVWVDEEVRWIVTNDERDVFLHLDSDAKRDRFIEYFWRQRDPSPGTEANEYRDLHYERLAYVDKNFGRSTPRPGWDTDRGRMWVLLGKPQSISRLPNTSQAVPVEIWFYSVDPALGVPPFFYVIFFRDRGMGDYRLWSPTMDGPQGLLSPSAQQTLARGAAGRGPGALGAASMTEEGQAVAMLREVDMELANAAASLVPGEGGIDGVSPLRSEIVLSRVFGLPQRLMPNARWAYNILSGVAESEVRFETLPLESEVIALLDPAGVPFLHSVARTQGDRLNLNNFEDRYYVTFAFAATVRDEQLRFLRQPEPATLQADLDVETTRRLRGGQVEYMDRTPAVDGRFIVDVMLENNLTREFGRAEHRVEVPRTHPTEVGSSRPFLAYESREIDAALYDPFADHVPFQVGRRSLLPALSGPFPTASTASLFWQLYVPADRVDPIEMTLSLTDAAGGLMVRKQLLVQPVLADANGVIDRLVEIDLTGIPPGSYALACDLDADERPPVVLPLRIDTEDRAGRPFLHALRQPPAAAGEVRLARAQQLRTLGRTDEAIAEVAAVLDREPEHGEALALQIELLTDRGGFEELGALLRPRLVARPNDVALLLAMAEVRAELADHYDAIRFYERALLAGAQETPDLLNALASEYFAEGRTDRVVELLRRSLAMRPEQSQIRRLLDEIQG